MKTITRIIIILFIFTLAVLFLCSCTFCKNQVNKSRQESLCYIIVTEKHRYINHPFAQYRIIVISEERYIRESFWITDHAKSWEVGDTLNLKK